MGCPLFSQRYDSPVVAIRVEPDDAIHAGEQPVCERWTYWKPFDPDSDEFFSNPVYEAFVEPVSNIQPDREPSPVVEESASSSEDESMSGRDTPIGDAISDGREVQPREREIGSGLQGDRDAAVVVRRVNEESEERLRRDLINSQGGLRNIVPIPITTNRSHRSHPPTPVTPPPPSTFPSLSTPLFQVTPSPVSDVTPRLYSWRDLGPSSPTRAPLVGPTARRPLREVSIVRLHDVIV